MIIGIRPITDHGGLTGLSDDDHTIYFKADGSRNLTGNLVTSGQGIRPAANSTTAIQIQDASGSAIASYDSTNFNETINSRGSIGLYVSASGTVAQGYRPGISQVLTIDSLVNATYAFNIQSIDCGLLYLGATNVYAVGAFGSCRTTGNNIPTYVYYAIGSGIAYNTTHTMRLTSNAVGINLTSTNTPSQALSFGGNSARTIWLERHTTAATAGNNLTIQAGAPKASESNLAGGTLYLSGAISTGDQKSAVEMQTATAGVSGTADNTPTTKFKIDGNAIGAFGVTPVVRPATGGASAAFAQNSGNAVNDASTFGGYTIAQVVQALQNLGWLT